MRLLTRDTSGDLALISFREVDIPPYAVLSHTWVEGEEVTYDEVISGKGKSKLGYGKIVFCLEQAERDGLRYSWIDTCCINKATSEELTEAINSMFRWYQDATRCYVFMSDVRIPNHVKEPGDYPITWLRAFQRSRWFTRGWTLQELLAPATVEFFAESCQRLGDKILLEKEIHDITGIEIEALRGRRLSEFSIDERMAWVGKRNTTLKEDKAYCLLGVFGIYMPLIYGEGQNAFTRLKEEIERSTGREDQPRNEGQAGPKSRATDFEKQDELKSQALQEYLERQERIKSELKEVHYQLRFGEMDHRYADIKLAQTKTCEWLVQTKEYQQWMENDSACQGSHLLWIKGKPGSGKSTLTKFALARTREAKADDILLSFFFNARGSQLEKNVDGLYRSLLWQLLDQEKECADVLQIVRSTVMIQRDAFIWKTAMLQELLMKAVLLLKRRSFLVFVDALDECDENEVRDMIAFFTDLAKRCDFEEIVFRVFLSSRYYPQITSDLSIELRLEDQGGHFEDISKYVQTTLNVGIEGQSQSLRDEICKRASGVFIWVVLVVRILNKEYDRGRTQSMRKHLNRLPADLGELFKNIVTKEAEDIEEMKICLQWILYASTPLSPRQLYFAILASVDAEGIDEHRRTNVSEKTVALYIISTSRGLAEISPDTDRVQLIHESVRDFFFGDNHLPQMWQELQRESQGKTHERLKRVCQAYLAALTESIIEQDIASGDISFCQYVISGVFSHAESACAQNIDQLQFLASLDIEGWEKVLRSVLNRVYHVIPARHRKTDHEEPLTELLSVLAQNNCPKLIVLVFQLHASVDIDKPFFDALNVENYESMAALCRADLKSHPHESSGPCYCAPWRDEIRTLKMKKIVPSLRGKYALTFLIQEDQIALACCLISSHKSFINAIDSGGRTALMLAATKGYHKLVTMLIRSPEIYREARDSRGQTALIHAARTGHLEIVRLLAGTAGCDVNASDYLEMTAMTHAARNGDFDIVELLLAEKAIVNTLPGEIQLSAIEEASAAGHGKVVELLYANGAHLGRCLQKASSNGHLSIVKALLSKGGDINAVDSSACSSLFAASANGHKEVVEFLIANGAQVSLQIGPHRSALRAAFIGNHLDVVGQLRAAGVVDEFDHSKFDFLLSSLEMVY